MSDIALGTWRFRHPSSGTLIKINSRGMEDRTLDSKIF